MPKTIIFDFNRTIFDPPSNRLMPGVIPVLKKLVSNGHALHLISSAQPNRRQLINSLGIAKYFLKMSLLHRKKH